MQSGLRRSLNWKGSLSSPAGLLSLRVCRDFRHQRCGRNRARGKAPGKSHYIRAATRRSNRPLRPTFGALFPIDFPSSVAPGYIKAAPLVLRAYRGRTLGAKKPYRGRTFGPMEGDTRLCFATLRTAAKNASCMIEERFTPDAEI